MDSKARYAATLTVCTSLVFLTAMPRNVTACELATFSKISRIIPQHSVQEVVGFGTPDGQSAELRLYRMNGAIVSMAVEYFTDDLSLQIRLLPAGPMGILFIGSIPDHEGTTFEFAECANGEIVPNHSPSKLFNDTEFKVMARSVMSDFFENPKLSSFTKQFVK